jgi:hypothetical protein
MCSACWRGSRDRWLMRWPKWVVLIAGSTGSTLPPAQFDAVPVVIGMQLEITAEL